MAVIEAKGKAATDNIATLKKGDMADRAPETLTGTGCFPPCSAPHSCAADDTGYGLVPGR